MKMHSILRLTGVHLLFVACICISAASSAITDDDTQLNLIDFSKPIDIKLQLSAEKYTQTFKLCQLKSERHFECNMQLSFGTDQKERSEASLDMHCTFTRAELENFIQKTTEEFAVYGKFTVSLRQSFTKK